MGPRRYNANFEYILQASKYETIETSDDLEDGLNRCDVIYTDTFISMGQEDDAAKRRKLFAKYQINADMLKLAKKDVKIMHCLPAHRGEEITSEILDGKNSIVWEQARNKMVVEKAIILYLLNAAR